MSFSTAPIPWPADAERALLRAARVMPYPSARDLLPVSEIAQPWFARQNRSEEGPFSPHIEELSAQVGAQVIGAHLAWLRSGCEVVRIESDAQRQIRRAGQATEMPLLPLGAGGGVRGGVVQFEGVPLEISTADPRIPPLRIAGFYWVARRDADGALLSIHAVTLVRPRAGIYFPAYIYEPTIPLWEYDIVDQARHPGVTGWLWRVMERVWAQPEIRTIPTVPGRGGARVVRSWDGAVRRLELQPDPLAAPVQRRLELVAPVPPPPAPARPTGQLQTLTAVRGYQRVVWVREDAADTAEGCAALDAGRERRSSTGARLLGVLRQVSPHMRGPTEDAEHPRPRVTRIVGAGGA